MEILGVVTVRPGSGTYLRGKASELLPQTLSWGMLIGTPQTRDLIGVRHGLEVQAARLAAALGTPEAIAELARHLETMADTIEDYTAFVAADMQFHQAVAARRPEHAACRPPADGPIAAQGLGGASPPRP